MRFQDQIYDTVIEALHFDDYQWQRERMIPYKSRNAAKGVEYVLYKCPKCGTEFSLRSEGDRLYCTVCRNAVRMNQYLLFDPEARDTVYFDGIDKWYDFQKEHLETEMQIRNFNCLHRQSFYARNQEIWLSASGSRNSNLTRDL